ncbi:peptide chain release factor N(5)-glutamine methyltransferase [Chrysiogenes arsenatis]|uniref:peptide chain release factor N(5)-glutamine methyltransferase n=1 Tax=Chrysiogenes arsenatis TaxID=309797 RepID=UPI000428681B|nr:peptide chain release factor N(5)-glutamine methyltransferase [Chrysiogenes arsenatis]
MSEIWTLQRLVKWASDYFAERDVNAPRFCAETLIALACQLSNRMDIYRYFDRPVTPEELTTFKGLLKRRVAGEPLAYIVGEQNFLGLDFTVGKGVLIPRYDTEVLALAAIDLLPQLPRIDGVLRILDLCCGSGAFGIAVVKLGRAEKVALTLVDIDDTALGYVQKNVTRHGGESAVSVVQSDMFAEVTGKFSLIVCNPPYLDAAHMQALDRDVQAEPAQALDGGSDGLDFYRILARQVPEYLVAGGALVLEAGYDQHSALAELFPSGRSLFDNGQRFRGLSVVY